MTDHQIREAAAVADATLERQDVTPILATEKPKLPSTSVLIRATDDATGIALLIEKAIELGRPLDELIEVQRTILAMRAEQEFNAALNAFRATCPPVPRTKWADLRNADQKKNGQDGFGFPYAPLDMIDTHCKPYLEPLGLSYTFDVGAPVGTSADRWFYVTAWLRHRSGHKESSIYPVPMGDNGKISRAQNVAAGVTFGKRQALSNILGLTTTDNFDDEVALAAMRVTEPPAKSTLKRPQTRSSAPQGDAPRQATQPQGAQDERPAGAGGGRVVFATQKQLDGFLRKVLDRAGISERDACDKFGIPELEQLPISQVDDVAAWARKVQP